MRWSLGRKAETILLHDCAREQVAIAAENGLRDPLQICLLRERKAGLPPDAGKLRLARFSPALGAVRSFADQRTRQGRAAKDGISASVLAAHQVAEPC